MVKFYYSLPYRVADINEEMCRLRPPRFLHPDGVVRPYNRYQADGDCLLKVRLMLR